MLEGYIKLTKGLTAINVAKLYDVTDIEFEVGDTMLEFDGIYVDVDDIMSALKYTEIDEADFEDYDHYGYHVKWEYRNGELVEFEPTHLCDTIVDELIGELEWRGYKVYKADPVREKLSVYFTMEDLRAVFENAGIEPTEDELTEFIESSSFDGFREVLIEDWFERMSWMV